jgi:hypothetical protein
MTKDEEVINYGVLFEVFKIPEPSLNPVAWAELAKALAVELASALAEKSESSRTPAKWEKLAKALAVELTSTWNIQWKKSRRPGPPRKLSSLRMIETSNKVLDLIRCGKSEREASKIIFNSKKLSKYCKYATFLDNIRAVAKISRNKPFDDEPDDTPYIQGVKADLRYVRGLVRELARRGDTEAAEKYSKRYGIDFLVGN